MLYGYVLAMPMKQEQTNNDWLAGMVDGPRLLENIFPNPVCRPSLRWLRTNQHSLPHVRIGRLIWFNPQQVKAHLDARAMCKVKGQLN